MLGTQTHGAQVGGAFAFGLSLKQLEGSKVSHGGHEAMKLLKKLSWKWKPLPFFLLRNLHQIPHPKPHPTSSTFAHLCTHGPLHSAMAILPFLHPNSTDPTTYLDLIRLSVSSNSPQSGRLIHLHLTSNGHKIPTIFLTNALLSMYVKFNLHSDAQRLFDEMPQRNVVTFSAMISSAIRRKLFHEAFGLFVSMQRDVVKPNVFTFSSILKACDTSSKLWSVHCLVIKYGVELDVFVWSSLIDLYTKYGDLENGYRIFQEMGTRDIVVRNLIIGGFAQSGDGCKAIDLFARMRRFGSVASQGTLTSILRACTGLVMVEMGRQVHVHVLKCRRDLILENALLDMYCKCGSVDEAGILFERMNERDVISWSTMISGLAQNGRSLDALNLFESMKDCGLKPNHITLVGVLFSCSHAGLVDEGWFYFRSMERLFGVRPGKEHCGCMVDMLARAGRLQEAVGFMKEMDFEPDPATWRSVLAACRVHKEVDLAAYAAREVLKLEPDDEGSRVVLSNIYADCERWNDVEEVRKGMRDRRLKKEPGRSWIEVSKETHVFIAGDFSHPQSDGIRSELNRLIGRIREVGYVPDTEFVAHDLGREQKEESIRFHSEKLAIAFGVANSLEGKPIRVMKNLRICRDCHTFAKLVTKTERKSIIIRDPVRFHHFQDGACSCRDYW